MELIPNKCYGFAILAGLYAFEGEQTMELLSILVDFLTWL